jgi:hypothetical protein
MFAVLLPVFALSCKEHSTKSKDSKVSQLPTLPETVELVSAGSFLPGKTVFINHIDFVLVKQDNDTLYLRTNNGAFVTPEGYRVGTKLKELDKDLKKHLQKEPGWGYYTKLKSGWNLAFCEGSSCTDSFPRDTSTVDWIFKRK